MGGCASKPKDIDGETPEDVPAVFDVTPIAAEVAEAPVESKDEAKEESKEEEEPQPEEVSETKAEEDTETTAEKSEEIKAEEKSTEEEA